MIESSVAGSIFLPLLVGSAFSYQPSNTLLGTSFSNEDISVPFAFFNVAFEPSFTDSIASVDSSTPSLKPASE